MERKNNLFSGNISLKKHFANDKGSRGKTSKLPLILSLSIIAIAVCSYFVFPAFHQTVNEGFRVLTSGDEERIRAWVSQFRAWGPVVLIVAMVIQMFLFIVPNILLIMISILSYGPVWGALLAWFGVFLASTVGYLIGNKLSPVIVHRIVSGKTQERLRSFIRQYGMKAVIVLRLSTLSNDGLSLVAGLLNMQYRRFITATLIGITPLITVIAILGKDAQLKKGLLWVGVVLFTGLVLYIVVDMRRKKKR